MSVRSFHSVFMASVVAGAALGCYLVSLRVASERAALEQVETSIVMAQRDIRLLQTEIGTRGRLAQLERWNVRVLTLSAPTADQILGDKFQLARMINPERKPAIEAPVVLASAPASEAQQVPQPTAPAQATQQPSQLLYHASLKLPEPQPKVEAASRAAQKPESSKAAQPAKTTPAAVKIAASKDAGPRPSGPKKKAGDKEPAARPGSVTKTVRTAKVDPLAPLPGEGSTSKGLRANR